MSIKRYEMQRISESTTDMVELLDGDEALDCDYVRYADHAAEIARLRAEADALRVDAERYRFLRSGGCGATLRFHNSNPASRDAVIDEAMGADA